MGMMSAYAFAGLKQLPKPSKIEMPPIEYARLLARELGYTEHQLVRLCRKREVVEARQMIMHLLKDKYGSKISLKAIGDMFGHRDHTTVIHSLKSVQDHLDTEPEYKERYYKLKEVGNG